jgi:hypothetical protein
MLSSDSGLYLLIGNQNLVSPGEGVRPKSPNFAQKYPVSNAATGFKNLILTSLLIIYA